MVYVKRSDVCENEIINSNKMIKFQSLPPKYLGNSSPFEFSAKSHVQLNKNYGFIYCLTVLFVRIVASFCKTVAFKFYACMPFSIITLLTRTHLSGFGIEDS